MYLKKFALSYLQENIGSTNPVNVYCIQQVFKVIGATLPSMSKENVQTIRYINFTRLINFKKTFKDNYILLCFKRHFKSLRCSFPSTYKRDSYCLRYGCVLYSAANSG